eukprot:TRINITY_DN80054_c0_g1_i1.p2 TRINITY_DN80054_c0_g1~~TRINITY_DN80054_c0_g1_i1.p2  ORF type:complete len:103 (+),score=14.97 TRINITY_DN80054_c0_g1_i1:235-543(+)
MTVQMLRMLSGAWMAKASKGSESPCRGQKTGLLDHEKRFLPVREGVVVSCYSKREWTATWQRGAHSVVLEAQREVRAQAKAGPEQGATRAVAGAEVVTGDDI